MKYNNNKYSYETKKRYEKQAKLAKLVQTNFLNQFLIKIYKTMWMLFRKQHAHREVLNSPKCIISVKQIPQAYYSSHM